MAAWSGLGSGCVRRSVRRASFPFLLVLESRPSPGVCVVPAASARSLRLQHVAVTGTEVRTGSQRVATGDAGHPGHMRCRSGVTPVDHSLVASSGAALAILFGAGSLWGAPWLCANNIQHHTLLPKTRRSPLALSPLAARHPKLTHRAWK